MDEEIIEKLKAKLKEEKAKIESGLKNFASEDKNLKGNWEAKYPNREDGTMEEEANETQEYDNLLSLEHSLELKLKDVNAALEKVEKRGYGICERCNKEGSRLADCHGMMTKCQYLLLKTLNYRLLKLKR